MKVSVDSYRDPWKERDDPMTPGQFRTALPLEVLPQVPFSGRDDAMPTVEAARARRCPGDAMTGSLEVVVRTLGPVAQIPLGEARAFGVDGLQIAVFRLRDGSVRALSAVCTHKGGPIADGTIDQRVVLCPLHMNAFELDTGCSTTGAPPLTSYPVRIDEDENIVLQLT